MCKAHGGKAQPLTRVAVGREGVGRSKQFPGGPSAQLVRPGHAQQRSPGGPALQCLPRQLQTTLPVASRGIAADRCCSSLAGTQFCPEMQQHPGHEKEELPAASSDREFNNMENGGSTHG